MGRPPKNKEEKFEDAIQEEPQQFTFPKREVNLVGLKEVILDTQKKYGPDSLFLYSKHGLRPMEYVSTDIEVLDEMLGGGLPVGKMVMIYGKEGAGKSSFAMHMARLYELFAYVDLEFSLTKERIADFGIDENKMLISQPETAEQAFQYIIQMAQQGVPLIIVDSIPAMTSQRQLDALEETDKNVGRAMTANVLNDRLSGVNAICNHTGTTILFVNQLRDKMNAQPFGEQYNIPGGHAPKHYSWWLMSIARKETITTLIEGKKESIGAVINFTVGQKNRSASPFQTADACLWYDVGFRDNKTQKEDAREARKRKIARMKREIEEEEKE